MDKLVNFSLLMNLCIGTIIGGFTGLCLSFIITSCLTFVSVSLIYNLYVDVCFIVIGGLMLQKVYNKNKKIDIDFGQKQKHDDEEETAGLIGDSAPDYKHGLGADILYTPLTLKNSTLVSQTLNQSINKQLYFLEYILAGMTVLSGALGILLDKELFSEMDDMLKIPIYAWLSCSLSFTINYTSIDMIENTMDWWHFYICKRQQSAYTPLVVSNIQHYLLLVASIMVGVLYGAGYGFIDIESLYEVKFWLLEAAFYLELLVYGPIGIAFGGVVGGVFTFIRYQELDNRESEKEKEGRSKKQDKEVPKPEHNEIKEGKQGIRLDSSDEDDQGYLI